MNIDKEEQIFIRHMAELSKQAMYRNQSVYSNFLSLNEQNLFLSSLKDFERIPYSVYGGAEGAERVVVCFHGELEGMKVSSPDVTNTSYFDAFAYPVSCIKVVPANVKFAEQLTHRDYLGAILNLGIDRSLTGDIIINDKECYIFCLDKVAEFISQSLDKVKHTNIKTEILSGNAPEIKREYREILGTVSSVRLDSIIALGFNTSRNSILPLISSGKVFVNGRENLSNSYALKEGDIISVRGHGKLRYESEGNMTKKGRISVRLLKYI